MRKIRPGQGEAAWLCRWRRRRKRNGVIEQRRSASRCASRRSDSTSDLRDLLRPAVCLAIWSLIVCLGEGPSFEQRRSRSMTMWASGRATSPLAGGDVVGTVRGDVHGGFDRA